MGGDVLNLYAQLGATRAQELTLKELPRKKQSAVWKFAVMPTGTLVAKEESEQEGYKE